MMRSFSRTLAASALLAFGAPLFAQGVSDHAPPASPQSQPQAPPQAPDQEILVEGNRIPEERIQSYVRAMDDERIFGQIGQFTEGVCPASVGPSPAQNALIVKRIRRVAAAAKVPLAPENCTNPNLLVIVARDKESVIRGLAKKYSGLVSGVSSQELGRLARSPEPAVAWHIHGFLTADGMPAPQNQISGTLRVEARDASRLRPSSRPTFLGSVVVIDVDALQDVSVVQLADYAALRTLADTDPRRLRNTDAPSILTMFDDRAAGREDALSLTHWDLAYLKGLYSGPNVYYAQSQRGVIEREMKKDPNLAIQPER